MKLLTLNVYDQEFIDSIHHQTDGVGDEVLFVDWVPSTHKDFGNQIDMMSSIPDDVKLVIFDRYRELKEDMIDFLVYRGDILLEPVLFHRPHFQFMPHWISNKDVNLVFDTDEYKCDVGFIGDELYPEAENLLLNVSKISNLNIGIHTFSPLSKSKQISLDGVFDLNYGENVDWDRYKSILIVSSQEDYDLGVMPDIKTLIDKGKIPMLSYKHKWFQSMIYDFVIKDYKDILWWGNVKYNTNGFISDLKKDIRKLFPEMIIDNFITKIINLTKTC